MLKKKEYGYESICILCNINPIITRNKQGIHCCKKCKDSNITLKCEYCGNELECKDGKYGQYYYCWKCNINWSKYKLLKWKK